MRHRHRPLRTAAAAAVLLALALAGPASAAAPPPPKLVAKDLNGGSPTVVVDASGGTLVVWETSVNGFQRIATSYRAKGRKAFGRTVIVPLGAGLQSASDPSVAALGNELRIAFTGQVSGAGSTWVARSTNRGASWSVTRLPDVDGKAYASYSSNSTVITPPSTSRTVPRPHVACCTGLPGSRSPAGSPTERGFESHTSQPAHGPSIDSPK